MHKALYREYRPVDFEDVVGQDHIVRTLKNQIKDDNISHAYLFCGTRGTGKTSTAKIFSRSVNCENIIDSNPCNKCESCLSILDNSNLDVVEIDAASNNSVDDIRELRETVKYTPSNSKYKVYIIDEVHMLSSGAFNALLKTLEEPPSYVIFILATTEPNKIPATILSRCQRFDFKRVPINTLVDRMRMICEKECIEIDDDALKIIARNGQGSVRDSISILDKCVSFSSGKLDADEVFELLGSADPEQLFMLGKSIIDTDLNTSMRLIDEYFMWGKDLRILAQDLVNFFRTIMMLKIDSNIDDIEYFTQDINEKIKELSDNVDMEEVLNLLNILSELIEKLKQSSNQRMTFEIYIMKLSSPAVDNNNDRLLKRLEKLEKTIEEVKSNPNIQYIEVNKGINSNIQNTGVLIDDLKNNKINDKDNIDIVPSSKRDFIEDPGSEYIKENWGKLLDKLKHDSKMPLRVFLSEYYDIRVSNKMLYVSITDNFTFAISKLNSSQNKKYLNDSINSIFNVDYNVDFVSKSEFEEIFKDIEDEKSINESNLDEDNSPLSMIEKNYKDIIEIEE